MKYLSIITLAIAILLTSCGGQKESPKEGMASLTPQQQKELFDKAKQVFGTLPDKMPGSEKDTPEIVALGKKLYFETKLSVNNTQSCNTCHDIDKMAGADKNITSPGAIKGKIGRRNAPTVLNAGFQFVQFWDGRAKDLKEQAKGPMLNPDEMAMTDEKAVMTAISLAPGYKDMFAKAYPNDKSPLSFDNLLNAIAAFERTLVSKSRWDEYIGGKQDALSEMEKQGLKMFMDAGCIMCHVGNLFGGSMYQKMGLVHPYENTADTGRYEITKNVSDKYMFRVSQLRNIALTSPYFHDGKSPTLEDAVKRMGYLNLGKDLKPEEITHIVLFLGALSDVNLEKKMAKK